ncbi:MAG: S-methyl-5-thioribose-1-phosphate isomerase [Acidobacteriota bacterium]|nr:S-methyl-5-thioribose-1-phosphate isomerase [Acidobacteriota bacterium]
MIKTLEWIDGADAGTDGGATPAIRFIDQRKLPVEEVYVTCTTYEEVADAIRTMLVRGAPAIGVAAAMGVALGARNLKTDNPAEFARQFTKICDVLAGTRPTAVNLFWAIRRMRNKFGAVASQRVADIQEALIAEAKAIYVEDLAANEAMARHGATLMPSSGGVLTHCNAGALATAGGYGTALGVIRMAFEQGKKINVYADETRPVLQGSRLTAWELTKDGIPTTVISDNMAGVMMAQGKIQAVVVGADRIAANGDVANKIGTYSVAVLAHAHGIPFYVAAPWSTIDLETKTGDKIPIEQRNAREVTHVGQTQIAPNGIAVENPSFDVTPAKYVAAIITERGIARAPYEQSLRELAPAGVARS